MTARSFHGTRLSLRTGVVPVAQRRPWGTYDEQGRQLWEDGDDFTFMAGITGLDIPAPEFAEETSPGVDGSGIDAVTVRPRDVFIPIRIGARTPAELREKLRIFKRAISPYNRETRTATDMRYGLHHEPFQSTIQVLADTDQTDVRALFVEYTGGMEGVEGGATDGKVWKTLGLNLRAFDPWWYDDADSEITFTLSGLDSDPSVRAGEPGYIYPDHRYLGPDGTTIYGPFEVAPSPLWAPSADGKTYAVPEAVGYIEDGTYFRRFPFTSFTERQDWHRLPPEGSTETVNGTVTTWEWPNGTVQTFDSATNERTTTLPNGTHWTTTDGQTDAPLWYNSAGDVVAPEGATAWTTPFWVHPSPQGPATYDQQGNAVYTWYGAQTTTTRTEFVNGDIETAEVSWMGTRRLRTISATGELRHTDSAGNVSSRLNGTTTYTASNGDARPGPYNGEMVKYTLREPEMSGGLPVMTWAYVKVTRADYGQVADTYSVDADPHDYDLADLPENTDANNDGLRDGGAINDVYRLDSTVNLDAIPSELPIWMDFELTGPAFRIRITMANGTDVTVLSRLLAGDSLLLRTSPRHRRFTLTSGSGGGATTFLAAVRAGSKVHPTQPDGDTLRITAVGVTEATALTGRFRNGYESAW